MVTQGLVRSIGDLILLMDAAIDFCDPTRYDDFVETRMDRDGHEWAIRLNFVRPYWYMFELGVPITITYFREGDHIVTEVD